MSETLVILGQVQLGAALTTIWTPAVTVGPTTSKIQSMWICNTDTVSRNVTIRIGTGALTAANSIFEACPLPAKDTWVIDGTDLVAVVPANYLIQGLASAGAVVTVTLFGTVIV